MNIQPEKLNKIQKDILRQYPDYNRFIQAFSPVQLLVNYDDVNDIVQSVSKTRITLNELNDMFVDKENAAVDYIGRWIDYLNKFSNINNKLTEIKAVSYMIFKSYGNFYLSDLKVLFERIMRAEYGVFYNSVDAQRILYAFLQYNTERNAQLQKKRQQFQAALEKHIDNIDKEVAREVNDIMKEKFSSLTGPDYWDKKKQLTDEIRPARIAESRETFLANYENQTTK